MMIYQIYNRQLGCCRCNTVPCISY